MPDVYLGRPAGGPFGRSVALVARSASHEAERERPELSAMQGTAACALLSRKAGASGRSVTAADRRRRREVRDWQEAGARSPFTGGLLSLVRGFPSPASPASRRVVCGGRSLVLVGGVDDWVDLIDP